MKNKFSISRIAAYSCMLVFAVFCLVMLAFPTLQASSRVAELRYPESDSGFVWLTFDSNISYGNDWEDFAIPLGLISIFQLLIGIAAIFATVLSFLNERFENIKKLVFGLGLGSMFLYAAEGIAYKAVYCDIMNYDSKHFGTAAFVPLIIGVLMVVGHYLCLQLLPGKEIAVVKKTVKVADAASVDNNGENVIALLTSYKELLDSGIITQEEFDAKKKQLLGL